MILCFVLGVYVLTSLHTWENLQRRHVESRLSSVAKMSVYISEIQSRTSPGPFPDRVSRRNIGPNFAS